MRYLIQGTPCLMQVLTRGLKHKSFLHSNLRTVFSRVSRLHETRNLLTVATSGANATPLAPIATVPFLRKVFIKQPSFPTFPGFSVKNILPPLSHRAHLPWNVRIPRGGRR